MNWRISASCARPDHLAHLAAQIRGASGAVESAIVWFWRTRQRSSRLSRS
jgi:hypothetical protein